MSPKSSEDADGLSARPSSDSWFARGALDGSGSSRCPDSLAASRADHSRDWRSFPCILSPRPNKYGYGNYRRAYRDLYGPKPKGTQLDHLCEVKACIQGRHLEAVPCRINLIRSARTKAGANVRKTHCPKGHEYTPENTRVYFNRSGRKTQYPHRVCVACQKARPA